MNIRIGILREDKRPIDRRVVLIPEQARQINDRENVSVSVETSDVRAFLDEEYKTLGLEVSDDVSSCDVLLGVKEVPIPKLIPNKTYFFFSHTIKAQPYNRGLLQEVLKKNITLIDWECLTNSHGQRLIAFGRYAGIVGAYNGILTFGKKSGRFELRPAHQCHDLEDLKTEYKKVNLPPIRIALTGGGRVAHGAMEVLDAMGIAKVSPQDFLSNQFETAVYTQLDVLEYNKRKDGADFSKEEFFHHPEDFEGNFLPYAQVAEILIGAAFWDPRAPRLFTVKDAQDPAFALSVIADITMDIEGSIPSTKMASTIESPHYDYNPHKDQVEEPFSSKKNITVMAVDNLPCELPRDASRDFGRDFINHIMTPLMGEDPDGIIERATIADNGKLTPKFSYLQGYVDGL